MSIPYNEALSVEFGLGVNQANTDYRAIHGIDIPYDPGMISVHSERAAWDYYVGGLTWEQSKVKHLNDYRDVYGLPHIEPTPPGPVPPFPPLPTRDQLGNVNIGFQGEMVSTQEFGTFPVFGPETTTLSDADLHSYCSQLASRGYTHGEIALSWRYDEADFHYPVPGRDLSHDLDELARRIRIMLKYFIGVQLHLAGDGMSNADRTYNDPQGWTYGYEWLIENLPRIVNGLKSSVYGDVTPYIVWVPGYDGVFYGWGPPNENPDRQPDRVRAYGSTLRSLLPDAVIGLEFSTGHIPLGEGVGDYSPTGRMKDFDVILAEYASDAPHHADDEWQINGRMVHPYHRPADQPASDDPAPPYYLAQSNARGLNYFFISYERETYSWVRQRISRQTVADSAAYHKAMGCENVCFQQ